MASRFGYVLKFGGLFLRVPQVYWGTSWCPPIEGNYHTLALFAKCWALLVTDYITVPDIHGYQNQTPILGTTHVESRFCCSGNFSKLSRRVAQG